MLSWVLSDLEIKLTETRKCPDLLQADCSTIAGSTVPIHILVIGALHQSLAIESHEIEVKHKLHLICMFQITRQVVTHRIRAHSVSRSAGTKSL